jgi:hypothetical protein
VRSAVEQVEHLSETFKVTVATHVIAVEVSNAQVVVVLVVTPTQTAIKLAP